jgi:DNA-binding transcriptional ArsR family regulator
LREFVAITKALADENRLRIIMALRGKELCVCQVTEMLELAPSTVSKHMSILKQARLIEGRKSGRWVFYKLDEEGSPPEAKEALKWICESLSDSPEIKKDKMRLKKILKIDPEILCKTQSEK